MYTLLSGFYAHLTRKEEFYVIILGLDNAGKTTLLERIKQIFLGVKGLSPEQVTPTVGLNVGKVDMNRCRVNFWDLGGHRDLQSIWEKYYRECHGIMFVIDACDADRLVECRETFEKVMTNGEVEGVPVLMIANKQDLPDAMKVEQIKEEFNQIALKLDALDSRVLPASALTGEGVREAVEWMVTRVNHNRENRPPVYRT